MARTNSRQLTLTTEGADTTIRVTYNAVFTVFERHLTALGLEFHERIAVIGVDPPGSTSGTVLRNFPNQRLPVTDGSAPQTIARVREITVPRDALQEDPAPGDADEIRCRIRIDAVGLPSPVGPDEFTDQEILAG